MTLKDLRPLPWQRWTAWGASLGLFASGLLLAFQVPDSVRLQGSRLHGALAMAFLLILGTLFPHGKAGLKAGRNTAWGLALLASLGILIVSAWGLYYLPEDWKSPVAKAHLWCGIALPLLIWVHAFKGRR